MRILKIWSAAALLSFPLAARAQQAKKSLPAPPPVPARPTPNWGKVTKGTVVSVNPQTKTITISAGGTQASYSVTKNTRLHRNRKHATLSDVVIGDHVMLARFNSATKEAVQLELFSSSGIKPVAAPKS